MQGMNIHGQIEIEDDIIDILSDEEDSLDGDIKIKVDILNLDIQIDETHEKLPCKGEPYQYSG